ncbi:MAG: ribosome recycling factor [Caldilineaceae bacterium SB0675_bin_29]|uniref:Ribosome-recycling factor n=1 Tax=Caldilineaceae bacterium SB0675_bin_29 TaxID=2605266 RepID=A0A6B1G9T3_9CHLR|nr:ribosome recycling factor [Caldilineaceae bacterium SB0675_bin_29]
MIEDIMDETRDRMNKAIYSLQTDLMTIRTGRASPALVERLSVDYHGVPTPLMQIASISVPEAQTLQIRPYTPADIGAIERAIAMSDIGLTPSNDGKQIHLTIPPLTEERRRDLTKQVSRRAEEARVAIRNIRRDAIKDMRSFEGEGLITEDDLHDGQDLAQEVANDFVANVDEIARDKETEIMTI